MTKGNRVQSECALHKMTGLCKSLESLDIMFLRYGKQV